jgi:CheY-like chemotaxis protein
MATPQLVTPAADHALLALLVDRDPDTRKMYAEYLRLSAACDTDEAEDGREALAKAMTRHPDVIVTETRLPGINGFDLCALLRRDTSTSAIRIIFVTGDAFETDVRRAERVGADAVLTKPCLPEVLLGEIRRVLRESMELRQRGAAVRARTRDQLEHSNELIERSQATAFKRTMLSRTHVREDTTEPPIVPPALICPHCDMPLRYLRSHVGGVSVRHPEQWDYFECTAGCGTFQYRERTRKLRKV